MDMETVLTTITSAGSVAAAVGYTIKKSLLQEYPWNTEIFTQSWRQDKNMPLMESTLGPLKEKIVECHRRIDDLYDLIREEVQFQLEGIAQGMQADHRVTSPSATS